MRFTALARTTCMTCQAANRAAVVALRPSPPSRPARPAKGRHSLHLAWIRTLPCAVRSARCGSRVHAHHVRTGTGGGMGLKPDDRHTVPLCPAHHLELHNGGAMTFEARHGVRLRAFAELLASRSPFLAPNVRPEPANDAR